jgi:hypothetical protein
MNEFWNAVRSMPWDAIATQSGDCSGVPDALASLSAEDPDVRRSGYWRLDNHVVVQGGLYSGAFYLVPFLVQLLRSKTHLGQSEILDLLCEIASGTAEFESTVSFAVCERPFVTYIPDKAGLRFPLVVACQFAIATALSDLIRIASHPDPVIRKKIFDLMRCFPTYAFPMAQKLKATLQATTDTSTRSEIYALLRELGT